MRRYLIFHGKMYYPAGPEDIVGQADSLDACIEACTAYLLGKGGALSYASVYDLVDEKTVWEADTADNGEIKIKTPKAPDAKPL